MRGLGVKAARIAIVVALFAIWEILSRTGLVNPRLLPSASDTLATLGELLQRELRHDDQYESAYRTWRAAKPFALKGTAERYPKREELHDRPLLRRR